MAGINANKVAWEILKSSRPCFDAVEAGVMVTESETNNCCIGLNAYPDRDGFVTLGSGLPWMKSNAGRFFRKN